MKAVMFVIIVFFIGAGYFGANMFGGDPNRIAEVDGVSISSEKVQREIDMMRQRDGESFEKRYPTEASRAQLRSSIEQQLIDNEVVTAGIARAGFTASEEQVKHWLRTNENFQVSGEYSPERVRSIMQQNGLTESRLQEIGREEIARQQLQNGLQSTSFALDHEVETLYRLQEQTRDVRVLRVPLAKFSENLTFDDEVVEEYYQQNQARFMQPEQVNLRYVRLSADLLLEQKKAEVTDEEVEAYYEQQKSNYLDPAEIQVAHILIENSVDNAEEKAKDLLARIQSGADFAQLAEEHSSDTFSAEDGGKLDWVDAQEQSEESAGTGWAPEFEKAALALENKGDISGVVETSFGYHILKLIDRREGKTTPLSEVREEIVAKLAEEKADEEFYSKETKLNDVLFEYGNDIELFAEQAGLEVKETGVFTRSTATGVAANPALLEKAFSAKVIDSSEVSDKIELGSKDIVYVTAKVYKAEAVKPLEEVKPQIITALTKEKAAQDAEEFANNVLNSLENGDSAEELLLEEELTWIENSALKRRDSAMDFALVSAVYELPAPEGDESSYRVKPLFNGDYAVIELRGVNYPDFSAIDEATKTQLEQTAKSLATQSDSANLVEYFKTTVEVSR
ncbi:peptidylprolyl isomerase [Kangiella japonica]|uniref:Periplasmic chaperone PpiD n=2 Tax=Kangiella japonica TaxID=647384 RepID=A0ABN0SWE0_9GAMM